jgi:hypothetical protein
LHLLKTLFRLTKALLLFFCKFGFLIHSFPP